MNYLGSGASIVKFFAEAGYARLIGVTFIL
jgi:hypothetical protein